MVVTATSKAFLSLLSGRHRKHFIHTAIALPGSEIYHLFLTCLSGDILLESIRLLPFALSVLFPCLSAIFSDPHEDPTPHPKLPLNTDSLHSRLDMAVTWLLISHTSPVLPLLIRGSTDDHRLQGRGLRELGRGLLRKKDIVNPRKGKMAQVISAWRKTREGKKIAPVQLRGV